MLNRLKHYLLLRPTDLEVADPAIWRQSALRIIVSSALLLVLGIALHSSWRAWQLQAWHVIWILLSFYAALFGVLYFARRHLRASASGLLLLVAAASACMLLFINQFELAKLGIIFIYTLPLLALMFFSLRVSIICMLLNLLPFAFLLRNQPPTNWLGIDITLPGAHSYLHGLLFLFFNFCLPLATARIFNTLHRHRRKLQQLNKTLSQSHDFYQELFEHNGSATLLCAQNGRIIKANTAAQQLLALPEAEPQLYLNQLLQCEQLQEPQFWLQQDVPCQLRQQPQVKINLKHMMLTRQRHHIVQLQDISSLHQLQQQLTESQQQQSLWQRYDRLTCLPNQEYFSELVDQRLLQQPAQPVLMLIIRLGHIKTLNQQFGYEFGNQVLLQFARSAEAALPAEALFARLRGVKFALLLPLSLAQQAGSQAATQKAEQLLQQLPAVLELANQQLILQYQAGASTNLLRQLDAATLLQKCEIALELADHNQPLVHYQTEQASQLQQDYELAIALKAAIAQQQLQIWLQPKVDQQGQICAFEALSRWQYQGRWIAPDVFIDLASRHGLIIELSKTVLTGTVEILQQWQQLDLELPIAMNLAGPEVLDDHFFALLLSLSADHPWLTQLLQLEITETNIAVQQQLFHKRLRALSQYGFSIAIDDFGTGHASLSQLVDLPADTLKIDRRFVEGIPHNKLQVKILFTTIQLAKSLQLTVIAEGVENDIQRRFLNTLGCQQQQGYFFGKPAPVEFWQQRLLQQARTALTLP